MNTNQRTKRDEYRDRITSLRKQLADLADEFVTKDDEILRQHNEEAQQLLGMGDMDYDEFVEDTDVDEKTRNFDIAHEIWGASGHLWAVLRILEEDEDNETLDWLKEEVA